MLINLSTYLIQATVSLAIFALAYRLFFYRLTHFHWNRVYLLASVLISGLAPLLPQTGLFSTAASQALAFRLTPVTFPGDKTVVQPTADTIQTGIDLEVIGFFLLALYLVGFLYKSWRLYRNLDAIFRLIRTQQKVEEGPVYSVYFQSELPTFSFWRHIFISTDDDSLTLEEQAQVLLHEEIHVRHRHTLDLLLFELAGIVFWFNPVVYYLHLSIRQVHEYTVDAMVTRTCGTVKEYGYLLLKLTSQKTLPLLATFSNKQIFRRVQMLTQKPSSPMQKLKFLIVLPLLALVLFMYSCFQNNEQPLSRTDLPKLAKGIPIGRISWKGNTVYAAERLNTALGVRQGDLYDKETFKNRLFSRMGADVASLYMDKGYLFFDVDVKENRAANGVDLELQVFEGEPFTVGAVTFKGNRKIPNTQLAQTVAVRSGELFNRSKLIQSQQALAESGYFDARAIGINPTPDVEHKTVNLEFSVTEKQ